MIRYEKIRMKKFSLVSPVMHNRRVRRIKENRIRIDGTTPSLLTSTPN
jgi:hypothetical protein